MRANQMYGNQNGLPGLPKTTYVTVGGRRVQPTRSQMRAPPPPPPMTTRPAPILRPTPAPIPRPAPLMIPQGPDPTLSRRIDTVESRVVSTEQSNRTLLDELMRLQQDIKGSVRRNELGIQEERDARSRLEMTIRQTQQKTYDADERLKRCEDGVKDNRGAVQQLSLHVKNIEKMVESLKQDHMEQRRGGSSVDLDDYKGEIHRLTADNDQLERLVKNLQEDSRNNSGRIERLSSDVQVLTQNLRLQSKLMEDNARKAPPPPRENGVDKRVLENDRANTEAKIMQLNATIQDLSLRLSDETRKREDAERNYKDKINVLMEDIERSKSHGAKTQKDYDDKMAEIRNGFTETDKRQMKMEMTRISNELNQKIDKNEAKLRADTVEKLAIIEKTLREEHEKREGKHKELEDKVHETTSSLLNTKDEDKTHLKKKFEEHAQKNKDSLVELNKRMSDVEDAFRTHKLAQEKILNAEITERLNNDKILDARVDDLEDDVQLGFQTLQSQLGGHNEKPKGKQKEAPKSSRGGIDYDEIKEMQEANAAGVKKQVAKDIAKMEARIAALETEMQQKEDHVHNRLESSKAEDKENSALMGDQLQKQIDALVIKHTKLKKQVDAFEGQMQDTPKSLNAHKDETKATLEELAAGLKKERTSRKENVEQIHKDIAKIVGKPDQGDIPSLAQLHLDVDQTQTGLKKCAESIHVVKKILTEKIGDEKKLREKENAILTSDVDRLDTKIKDLKERIKGGTGGAGPGVDDEDFL